MSNKGRSSAAKKRRHAKAMAKRKAEKDQRKAEYEAKIRLGTNSRRNKIASKKRIGKTVGHYAHNNARAIDYVSPSKYWKEFWS